VYSLDHQVLRTDVAGMPLEWITYRDAVRLYHLEQVQYACGILLYTIRGGINAITGRRSVVEVNSIIATRGESHAVRGRDLSCDHVTPMSRGGEDSWSNVVTACKRCNNHKAGRTPEEAGLKLLAIPFAPTHAEYIFLRGRRVLADQMEFLLAHFPRTSPLHERIQRATYQ